MMILAIDASVGVSVALHDGTSVCAEVTLLEHAIQGELTAQSIQDVLTASGVQVSDITDVVVGVGPGPYTGLRVGITTGLVFGHARGIRVHGLCSLDAIAHDVRSTTELTDFIVVTDARRKELYWAHYRNGESSNPQVATPLYLHENFPQAKFFGPGTSIYPDVISGTDIALRAGALANVFVAGAAQLRDVVPMYLRKPDAVEPVSRKLVTP